MSITIYTGRPGTGKTYSIVREALKLLNQGEIIYSNFKIEWNGYTEKKTLFKKFLFLIGVKKEFKNFPKSNLRYWRTLEDIMRVSNGFIIMDEANVYMNSRRWKSLPPEFERKLAQHRKDGLHIIGSAQNIKRIDVMVREIVDYWFHCSIWWNRLVLYTEFDIDEDTARKHPLVTRFWIVRKKYYDLYDTLAKINL